jgi:hypothetical protein
MFDAPISELSFKGLVALCLIYLLVREGRFYLTNKRKAPEATGGGEKMQLEIIKKFYDGILKFLEVSEIVRQNSTVLGQLQKDVEKMSKAQDQIYDLIRDHEGRVSCLEGIEKARGDN